MRNRKTRGVTANRWGSPNRGSPNRGDLVFQGRSAQHPREELPMGWSGWADHPWTEGMTHANVKILPFSGVDLRQLQSTVRTNLT